MKEIEEQEKLKKFTFEAFIGLILLFSILVVFIQAIIDNIKITNIILIPPMFIIISFWIILIMIKFHLNQTIIKK